MFVLCFEDGVAEATILPSFVNILASIGQIITMLLDQNERSMQSLTEPFTISTQIHRLHPKYRQDQLSKINVPITSFKS